MTQRISVNISIACILILLFFIQEVNAGIYYVKNGGNDSADGLSDGNAWATISKLNTIDYPDGSVVYLKRGSSWNETITLSATISGNGVSNITIQDYGSGNLPKLNADVARPVDINCSSAREISNLTIKNIDISGQDWLPSKSANINIRFTNGLTLDGIYGNGYQDYGGSNEGKNAITLWYTTGITEIKNCELFNWGLLFFDATTDFHAIYIQGDTGTILIHDNLIHDIEADAIQLKLCNIVSGSSMIYDNEIYNCMENAIDSKASENIEIYRNEIYYTTNPLFESVAGERNPAITIHTSNGEGNSANILIRDNYIHDIGTADNYFRGAGVQMSALQGKSTYNIEISHNWFENMEGALHTRTDTTGTLSNIDFHNNLIKGRYGNAPEQTMFIHLENGNTSTIYMYNNTFYANGTIGERFPANEAAIWFERPDAAKFRNNIIYINDPDTLALKVERTDNPHVSHNIWHNADAGDDIIINYQGAAYTEAQQTSWRSANNNAHPGELFDNPDLSNPASKNFALQGVSPCINAAFDVGNAYKDGWNPASPLPPNTVTTLNQNNYGANWEIGAYVYTGGAPVNTAPIVDAGTDQDITLPAGATLDGTVTDDGLPNPPGAVTTTWTKVSGPGTVTIGNSNAVDTTASFSDAGTYVLRISADDSDLQTSDEVTVTVNGDTTPPAAPTGLYIIE